MKELEDALLEIQRRPMDACIADLSDYCDCDDCMRMKHEDEVAEFEVSA